MSNTIIPYTVLIKFYKNKEVIEKIKGVCYCVIKAEISHYTSRNYEIEENIYIIRNE